jgi:hypothetical protein
MRKIGDYESQHSNSGRFGCRIKLQAWAEGVTPSRYARLVLEQALSGQLAQESRPKKSAFGLLAQYGPGPSEEEIDENRKEMFRGFAEDIP